VTLRTSDSCGAVLVKCSVLHHVALPGSSDGLRCDVVVPATESCRCRRCSRCCCGTQHEPGLHALLVRTGGSLCPVQTESESSPRARACCSLYYISILLALARRHCISSALTVLAQPDVEVIVRILLSRIGIPVTFMSVAKNCLHCSENVYIWGRRLFPK